MSETLIQSATILLDRIEVHGLDLSRRLCVLRQSGDPIELPIDLEALVGIAQGFLAATPLTEEGITGRVNETGAIRTTSEGFDQLHVNRIQAQTIANLVQLLMQPGVNHADVQRVTQSVIDSDDGGHPA